MLVSAAQTAPLLADDDKRFIPVANCRNSSSIPFLFLHQSQVSAFATVASLSCSSLFSAAVMFSGTNIADEIPLSYPGQEHDAIQLPTPRQLHIQAVRDRIGWRPLPR